MRRAKKIRLKPTPEQETLFWKSAKTARWAYNYFLSENERVYKEYLENGQNGVKYRSGTEIRKYINNTLKKTTHLWLSEVGSNVMKQSVKPAEKAYQDWLSGKRGKPHYKSKHKSKISFYVNYESLTRKNGGFHGEKIGFVKTAEPLPKLPKGENYANPYLSYDGKYWYLSVGYSIEPVETPLSGNSLGIDLGIKDLAVCSNGKVYPNIHKSVRMRKLSKRLQRQERNLSRKIEHKISGYHKNRKPIYKKPLKECANIQKQIAKIRLIYKQIRDVRQNYLHQTTNEIVKTKPSRIVMETLNIKGMRKNRHLSKTISEQCFYEFKRQIQYKSEYYGIEFVKVPPFYPSSKTCSHCGGIKNDLKLSDLIYKCRKCGLVIDRDFNASLNLATYPSA